MTEGLPPKELVLYLPLCSLVNYAALCKPGTGERILAEMVGLLMTAPLPSCKCWWLQAETLKAWQGLNVVMAGKLALPC